MRTAKPLKPTYAWAVVSKGGSLCKGAWFSYAVHWTKDEAEVDCAPTQRVTRVRITEPRT